MKRFFNTAGPNRPEHHYTLPARERLPGVQERVERGEYFVLYAPRQSGKTTTMQAWAEELTAHGQYSALLVSMETGAAFPNDVGAAELAILASWQIRAKYHLPPELCPPAWPDAMPHTRIQSALRAWTKASPRPLVVFVDEIDALQDEALFSVLRQIRAGFIYSREGFPRSMGFVGMRNVRALDFSRQGRHHERIGSFYNIIAEVYRLRDFGEGDVRNLYAQQRRKKGRSFCPRLRWSREEGLTPSGRRRR